MKKMLKRVLVGLCLSVGIVSYGVVAQADILNVPTEYPTIQEAIDAAVDGDTVLVDNGTYTENINFLGKAITVISVNGPESTIIDGNASGSVVTFNSGEGTNSVLSGFTICNGETGVGGGIFCKESSPTITNCTISDNSVGWYGGGIFCEDSSPTITNCTISGNSADYNGGGIYCWDSSPIITNCTISGNSADVWGGGIYCGDSSPTITNCTISDNSAGWDGGGIFCEDSSPTITNCTISGNSADLDGGGIFCQESSPTITNCTISGNSAGDGGGISCYWNSSPIITNCTISGNLADVWGGGIFCLFDSSSTITNCTISGNSAAGGGGVCCRVNSSPTVVNSILWGDSPDEIYLDNSSIDITYSNIEGGWGTGEGNIDADPLFVGGGDYHLTVDSPCIDAGTDNTTNYPTLPTDDIDGDARPQGAGYDMGSDEYVPEVQLPVPDVKANNEDGPITITPDDTLSVKVELDAGDYAGEDADWWAVAVRYLPDVPFPVGLYWYNVSGGTWVPEVSVTYQGPLFDLTPPFEILNISGLSIGIYNFYFGIDMLMNGVVDSDELYLDSVVVDVE
jgi:parallel beta-helix repeat protein